MKKYFIFGVICSIVLSCLYPIFNVLLTYSNYYGINWKIVALIAFILYAVIASIIWIKLKSKFGIKNLLLLCIGSIIGVFVTVLLSGLRRLNIGLVLSPYSVFQCVVQIIMQSIPYLVACLIGKTLANKKFIKTGEK